MQTYINRFKLHHHHVSFLRHAKSSEVMVRQNIDVWDGEVQFRNEIWIQTCNPHMFFKDTWHFRSVDMFHIHTLHILEALYMALKSIGSRCIESKNASHQIVLLEHMNGSPGKSKKTMLLETPT